MSKVIESSGQVINNKISVRDHAKSVWLFTEGKAKDNALLGNKGTNLCEMKALDLPVSFGFILTTKTCIEYNRLGESS